VHITNGSGTGGDGPAITNDLNPTVPKTVGDVLLEPAVIGVAVVVIVHANFTYLALRRVVKDSLSGAAGGLLALLKYPFYPLFILDNGMNSISKSLIVLTPA